MFLKYMAAGGTALIIASASSFAAECSLPADVQPGKILSAQCKICHEFQSDKPSKVTAPNIHSIFGEKAGQRKDFPKYSEGILGAAAKGLVWTEDNMSEYFADPKKFLATVNGKEVKHAMFFQMKDEQKRRQIIAFLKVIKDKPECN